MGNLCSKTMEVRRKKVIFRQEKQFYDDLAMNPRISEAPFETSEGTKVQANLSETSTASLPCNNNLK